MSDPNTVVPGTATGAADQPAPVEKAQTTTPDVVSVSLADLTAIREEVATLRKQQQKAQSERDQIKAQLSKSFHQKVKAVDALKDTEGWDEKEVADRKKAIADQYSVKLLEVGDDEPEPQPTAPPPIDKLVGVNTADEAKLALRKVLSNFELTEKDLPGGIEPFLRRVSSIEESQAIDEQFQQAVNKAVRAKAAKVQQTSRQLLEEQDAQQVVDALDTTGGIGGMSGAAGTPAAQHTNKATLDDAHDFYDRVYEHVWGKGGGNRSG